MTIGLFLANVVMGITFLLVLAFIIAMVKDLFGLGE